MEKLYAALISAFVAFFILYINTKIIEPKKEARKLQDEQFRKFYAPMYAYIRVMGEYDFPNKVDLVETKSYILLTEIGEQFTFKNLNQLVIDNSSYLDSDTLKYWSLWQIDKTEVGMSTFCKEIVKKYSQLNQEVNKVKPNDHELNHGIPMGTYQEHIELETK